MPTEQDAEGRRELIEAINREVRRSQNRTDAYDEAVAQAAGVNRTDLRCLDVLAQEGETTAGRLAELMVLTTGAITTVIDRLERAGYARRVRDETDRRRVLVALTDKAHTELWPYYEPLSAMSEDLFARYPDDQLTLLLDFMVTAGELHEQVLADLQAKLDASR